MSNAPNSGVSWEKGKLTLEVAPTAVVVLDPGVGKMTPQIALFGCSAQGIEVDTNEGGPTRNFATRHFHTKSSLKSKTAQTRGSYAPWVCCQANGSKQAHEELPMRR